MKEESITCNMSHIINQKDQMSFGSNNNLIKPFNIDKQEIKEYVPSEKNCLAKVLIK